MSGPADTAAAAGAPPQIRTQHPLGAVVNRPSVGSDR
jgi:hypothetical protein